MRIRVRAVRALEESALERAARVTVNSHRAHDVAHERSNAGAPVRIVAVVVLPKDEVCVVGLDRPREHVDSASLRVQREHLQE